MRSIKTRIYPNSKQKELIHKSFGCARLIYNKGLALKINRWEDFKENISWIEISKMVTFWKKTDELSFLNEPSRCIYEQALRNLDVAYKNFFNGGGFPKFKKKNGFQSFRVSDPVSIIDNKIKFPKLGIISCRGLRKFNSKIKTATITMNKSYQYFISWCIDDVIKEKKVKKNKVGIDMGIVNFATLSDGKKIENPRFHEKHENKIKHFSRKQAKCDKGSFNFRKFKLKTAREWQKISNKKNDFLHKLTFDLTKNHGLIALENLKIKNMTKSAAGTIEVPGKNVNAKSGINREILKLSWYEFRRMLEYKGCWYNCEIKSVDPKYTSQTCIKCDHKSKENRKSQSEFKCIKCGYHGNADLVASLNILKRAKVLS